LLKVTLLLSLKDKLNQLVPLFDRLNYETGEIKKSADASEQSTRHLLYLNKSSQLHAEESERTGKFLKAISNENQGDKKEIVCLLNFCIKYIESTEVTKSQTNLKSSNLLGID